MRSSGPQVARPGRHTLPARTGAFVLRRRPSFNLVMRSSNGGATGGRYIATGTAALATLWSAASPTPRGAGRSYGLNHRDQRRGLHWSSQRAGSLAFSSMPSPASSSQHAWAVDVASRVAATPAQVRHPQHQERRRHRRMQTLPQLARLNGVAFARTLAMAGPWARTRHSSTASSSRQATAAGTGQPPAEVKWTDFTAWPVPIRLTVWAVGGPIEFQSLGCGRRRR